MDVFWTAPEEYTTDVERLKAFVGGAVGGDWFLVHHVEHEDDPRRLSIMDQNNREVRVFWDENDDVFITEYFPLDYPITRNIGVHHNLFESVRVALGVEW